MHKHFISIHYWISHNKRLAVMVALVVLVACGFFASRITFDEDITKLIPKNNKSDDTAKVLGQLQFADKITVIFKSDSTATPDDLAEMATVFIDSLHNSEPYINSVQGAVDDDNIQQTIEFVYANLPLFLNQNDYDVISRRLSRDSISSAVAANYRSIISPTGIVTKDFIVKDPLGLTFIALKKLQQLSLSDDFELHNGFVMTKDKKKLLLFINPKYSGSETVHNTLFVDQLHGIKENLNTQFAAKNASMTYYGSALIAVANAKQIKSDIMMTVIISMTLLMLILALYYRKALIPVIIFIPTIFGVAAALALLFFIKGTISAISLSIGAVLLGVTIDYSLHILTHYKHTRDIEKLYKDVTRPLIMSSTTTAVAFLCLLFVESEALQDLGIFAAASVILSSLFSLLIIPHLYQPEGAKPEQKNIIDTLSRFSFDNNKFLIYGTVIIIIVSLFTFDKVRFNNDISQLNYVPEEIQLAEKELEASTNLTSKSLYVVTYGQQRDKVLEQNSALRSELNQIKTRGGLLDFSSTGEFLLSESQQQQKIAQWNAFWDGRADELQQNLITSGNEVGFKPTTHQPFYELLRTDFAPVNPSQFVNVKALSLNEFLSEKNGLITLLTVVKVKDGQRSAFVDAFAEKPNTLVIDRQQMNETFLGGLKNDFSNLINYSFIAVLLILFVFFRRVELVLISTIPIALTAIVTGGIMAIFGIELNVFSLIVCTLVFGHGVDFSIFMTSALQKEFTYGRNEMSTYRTSILLAVLTTVLGIGALIFAKHPALKSISGVSLIGVTAALVITFVFYPKMFRFVLSTRVANGKSPFEIRTLIHSTLSFIYYGLGGFLLSMISVLLIRILPIGKKAKMKAFHYMMSKFMKSVLYTNPFLIKRVVNTSGETFDKPAIIIANHSSFLDILAVGMLSPKIIFLVSDWVYNSPIFGKGVRLAGFYPVSQGIEGGVEHLREKINQGYSLMVFPEGSRSLDNHINRFHKGAFYLADTFKLDIIPVVIHGNSEVLPKGDFIINDGPITLNILPRIASDDMKFGQNYSERTKTMSTYFRSEYQKMRDDIEGVPYFKKMIVTSFAYKEYDVRKAVLDNLDAKLAFYYRNDIAANANILHLADDYGEVDVLLALQYPKRKIYSYIADEDKRAVATTNYITKKRYITYLSSIDDIDASNYDVLIISTNSALITDEFTARFKVVFREPN